VIYLNLFKTTFKMLNLIKKKLELLTLNFVVSGKLIKNKFTICKNLNLLCL